MSQPRPLLQLQSVQPPQLCDNINYVNLDIGTISTSWMKQLSITSNENLLKRELNAQNVINIPQVAKASDPLFNKPTEDMAIVSSYNNARSWGMLVEAVIVKCPNAKSEAYIEAYLDKYRRACHEDTLQQASAISISPNREHCRKLLENLLCQFSHVVPWFLINRVCFDVSNSAGIKM
ncbi:hypothetical protein EAI_15467 [Harpegnathos saltator]|uniref:Uncharacterized protein n=1 Tax=Harpegnathos saltator TaxID=610380 RepID=E2BC45_HARSA|nr:hypothetical protein EAI_15467 [Harpegnathos saltator]